MKDIEKLKKQLKEDNSFSEKFKDVKDADEAILLAKKLGYEVNLEELENGEDLHEDLLDAVSGGRKGGSKRVISRHYATGKGSEIFDETTGEIYSNPVKK